jgi:hypothetical protein
VVRSALAVAAITLSACATPQNYRSVDAALPSDEDVLYCAMQAQMATGAASGCRRVGAAAHSSALAETSILHRVIVPAEEQQPELNLPKPEPNLSR